MNTAPPMQFASLFSLPGLRPVVYRPETSTPEIVEQYIQRLRTLERSARTLDSVPSLLRAFAKFYPGSIGMLTARDVNAFIDSRGPLLARSKNNYLVLIRSLIHYAQRQRYLPKWWDELDGLEKWTEAPTAPGIYTPDEMRRLLEAACSTLIPGIVCVAFGGVRTAEIHRVTWSKVDLERRMIFVDAAVAKTRQRRICPVPDNLAAWLETRRGPEDRPLYAGTRKSFNTLLRRSLDRAGVTAKNNGLRHSFVSYRLAVIQDAAQVSLEAGNTQAVLFKHYRELVTPEAGRSWFNLWPAPAVSKVIPFSPISNGGGSEIIKPPARVYITNLPPKQREEIQRLTVGAALERWQKLYATGRKPRTVAYHAELMAQIRRHWPEMGGIVDDVTDAQCKVFAERIGHYSAPRFNSLVNAMRAVIPQMTCVPRRKQIEEPKAIPTLDEFERLLAALDRAHTGHSGLMIRFLALSGMRINEACLLRWQDIREDHICVPPEITINGKARCIPFIAGMEQVLTKLRQVRNRHAKRKGLVLPHRRCKQALRSACLKAGGPHSTFHTFRHYFAASAILSGVDFATVAKWMGHSDNGGRLRRLYRHLFNDHSPATTQMVNVMARNQAAAQLTAAEAAGNVIQLPPMPAAPATGTPNGSPTGHTTIAA